MEVNSDQIIINRKNIEAIAVTLKKQNKLIAEMQSNDEDLRRIVTNLTTEVNELRSQLNIQKAGGHTVIGATSV